MPCASCYQSAYTRRSTCSQGSQGSKQVVCAPAPPSAHCTRPHCQSRRLSAGPAAARSAMRSCLRQRPRAPPQTARPGPCPGWGPGWGSTRRRRRWARPPARPRPRRTARRRIAWRTPGPAIVTPPLQLVGCDQASLIMLVSMALGSAACLHEQHTCCSHWRSTSSGWNQTGTCQGARQQAHRWRHCVSGHTRVLGNRHEPV